VTRPDVVSSPTGSGDDGGDRPASPDFVQSLARGLAVIRAFDAHQPR